MLKMFTQSRLLAGTSAVLGFFLWQAVAAPQGARAADVRRLEAVGVVPLKPSQRGSARSVDDAIQAALREAVSRVARSFLMESEYSGGESGGAGEEELDVEKLLGSRMVPYTSRFRILDDRGERPAMFAEDPAVTSEYVVVVEVHVDAERVQQRLVEMGAIERTNASGAVSKVVVEVRGLSEYGALQALRSLLTERLGAQAAMPRGFKRGVALIDVEFPGGAADARDLAERLSNQTSSELRVQPVEVDGRRLAVTLEWTPPPPRDEPAPVGAWR